MLFGDVPVVLRGGGDLATGVGYQLHHAGFPVLVLELEQPLAIRRAVAFSTAVTDGAIVVDGVEAQEAGSPAAAMSLARAGIVAVLVSPDLPDFGEEVPVMVDARLAKRNIDTTMDQASLVVGLGPGFTAGIDCHAVVETMRGHQLGRVIWSGAAAPDTGVPGSVGGASAERLVRAPTAGPVDWDAAIGDLVAAGEVLGRAGDAGVVSPIAGVVRGLISPGIVAEAGLKIGDIDPRGNRAACFEISDKSRLVGGGVLQAILMWMNRRG